jgi:phosphoribosyl 1,2-cyclic phosphodiesterase
MRTFSLQSGSCGNCYYYESGHVRLLFDAGIPFRRACERMAAHGVDCGTFNGLFISHDHSDHTACAGVFHRKLKVPVFCSRDTHEVMHRRMGKVCKSAVQYFVPGDSVKVGHVTVETIPTPHDAVNPCAFIVDDGHYRVGILTDLGHCFPALKKCLADLDVAFLESNYDAQMLENNLSYPWPLKRRISGGHGHLENTESAEMVREYASDRLQVLLLSHLSQDNNCPDLAVRTAKNVLAGKPQIHVDVAPRDRVSAQVDRSVLRRPKPMVTQLTFDCFA